jgi:hypothetical protein
MWKMTVLSFMQSFLFVFQPMVMEPAYSHIGVLASNDDEVVTLLAEHVLASCGHHHKRYALPKDTISSVSFKDQSFFK